MPSVSFLNATKIYPGSSKPAVDDLTLSIDSGEFLVLVGPTGCGKSTILRMLAGLEELDDGSIFMDHIEITRLPPRDRDMAMVFQNYALYPHMTVAENMAFALKIAGVPQKERIRRVEEAASMLDLEASLGSKPQSLSGGQRQKVAIGRAIMRRPKVFLMDEPMSNLDSLLRSITRRQINQLIRKLGVTTIYVTHDQTEAMSLGDRIAVINQGRLQQVGSPRQIYDQPENVFVASFMGAPRMNLFEALVGREDEVLLEGSTLAKVRGISAELAPGASITLGVRAEDIELSSDGFGADLTRIDDAGANTWLWAKSFGGAEVVVRLGDRSSQAPLKLKPRLEKLHFFSSETGQRLHFKAEP